MRDPTREDMAEFLVPHVCSVVEEAHEIEIAMYWFAMYWHGGQSSNLYEVLSTSPYNPGPMGRLEGESDTVHTLYEALEAEYGGRADISVRRGPDDGEPDGSLDPIRWGALT